MAIQNEIVKFVAEMELDAKTTAQFTQGLKDANDGCDSLLKTIVDTQLKNASAHANKFASALGVNQMSMNQLKAYTKKLRNEMNSLPNLRAR